MQRTNLQCAFHCRAGLFFEFIQTFLLLALMSVLSQSFFTLVRRHFMSFFLFSAWHKFKIY